MKKWVVLQGIISANYGQRFWTKNHENPTQSDSGETWYKVILETDDEQEAKQVAAYGSVFPLFPGLLWP